jgi:hypothetical protein
VVTKRIKLKTIPSLIPNVIGNRPVKYNGQISLLFER